MSAAVTLEHCRFLLLKIMQVCGGCCCCCCWLVPILISNHTSTQLEALYDSALFLYCLTTDQQRVTCRMLQALNESSRSTARRRSANNNNNNNTRNDRENSDHPDTNNNTTNDNDDDDDDDDDDDASSFATLPKLLAIDITAWPRASATFFRGASLRTQPASEWLDLLASGRLARASERWFDGAGVLSCAVDEWQQQQQQQSLQQQQQQQPQQQQQQQQPSS
jgi:hypothetical protein